MSHEVERNEDTYIQRHDTNDQMAKGGRSQGARAGRMLGERRRTDVVFADVVTVCTVFMSRGPKVALTAAIVFSSFTIWAVHFQQEQEREVSLILQVASIQPV